MMKRATAAAALALLISGCTSGPGVVSGPPAPITIETASGSALTSLTLTGQGSSSTIDVSETGYSGTFTATSSNSAVATVKSTGGSSFVITAVEGGTATITIASGSLSTTLQVTVTTTSLQVY